jgi:hypothetical protein
LLTVLAIIGLFLGAAAPSLRGLLQSSGRTAALNELIGCFDQARSAALASGRCAYLVFADHSVASRERRCRAVSLYLDREDLSLPPRALTPWRTLPPGLSFRQDPGTASLLTAPPEASAPRFAPPGGGEAQPLPYVKFEPTGAVSHPGTSDFARLFVFSGYTEADGTQIATARGTPPDVIALSLFTGCARYQQPR